MANTKTLMQEIDELHKNGHLQTTIKQILNKRKRMKHTKNSKNKNKNKNNNFTTVIPQLYNPRTQRTTTQNQKLFVYCSALNASHLKHGITPDEVTLIFDSGASCTISPSESDFLGEIKKVQNTKISGIANGLEIEGTGTVEYMLTDDSGNDVRIRIENALYVPQCPVRLICPQQLADQTGDPDDGLHLSGSRATLHHNGQTLTIQYDARSNLPCTIANPGVTRYAHWLCRECKITPRNAYNATATMHELLGKQALEGETDNLSAPARELLMWHRKLGHRNFEFIQQLARDGVLPRRLAKVKNIPTCPDCKFGEQHKRPYESRGSIDASDSAPGNTISGDQMESNTLGLTMTTPIGHFPELPHELWPIYCISPSTRGKENFF